MANLDIYNAFCAPPEGALKKITGGKLNGKTDINPMWRIKALTELFGPCGIGWKYVITKQWTLSGANGEIAAFCNIDLYFKINNEWSQPIPGTGGSGFINTEKGKLVTNDECFKMALTDAISVAAKALGVAANIYWDKDKTKYTSPPPRFPDSDEKEYYCGRCNGKVTGERIKGRNYTAAQIYDKTNGICLKCYQGINRKVANSTAKT